MLYLQIENPICILIMKKNYLLILLIYLIGSNLTQAQVGINNNGNSPDASAMLDVQSTTSGLLIPRMTANDRDNISSPATGLTVFVTDDNHFYYFDGTSWIQIQDAGSNISTAWSVTGNSGLNSSNFLGTTDAQSLIIKTNNTERMRIKDNGVVGINTTPDDVVQLNVSANDKDIIGKFVSSQADTDDFGVYGEVAATDYYGYGGVFVGGYVGVESEVTPTGGNYYYGNVSYVSGGSGHNFGYYSKVSGTGTNYGFYGSSNISNGNGSIGYFANTADDGIGLITLGSNVSTYYISPDGAGINATGSLLAIGGYTDLDDDSAIAVEGSYEGTTSTDATGVLGYSAPDDYYGYGVKGFGGYYGVWGQDINGVAAVFANGDLDASGTKSFVIDHPQDPKNKYLKHFSIESNEVLNVYRGVVKLNSNGSAKITMPSYFKVINKNFSYQLTPIGHAAPNLYIAKEINRNGTFAIAGGQPGQKIAWVVYAERNDPYLQQHPEKRQVEVLKKGKEKGKYLMPELYNQPNSKALVPISSLKKNNVRKMKVIENKDKSPEKRHSKSFRSAKR
jgi:hypothetical protein